MPAKFQILVKRLLLHLPLLPLLVGFLTLPFFIWEQYGSSLLMGLEQVRIYNRFQVVGRTIAVVVVFALVGGLARVFGGSAGAALRTALALAQGGEFGFVLLAQAGADAKREEFLRGQGWNQQQLGAMIAAMQGAPYATRSTSASVKP